MAFVYWDVRPVLISLGPVAIRWYGLLFAMLFAAGYLITRWQFRTESKGVTLLDDLLVYVAVGTIAGARLGHCLLYEPSFYLSHPLQILKIWEGGLASHGGAAGVLVALWLFARRHPDLSFLWLLDRVSVPTALAACLIRLGNLFNSEILGLPTSVPWAFVFVRVSAVPVHPVQLYESTAYLLCFLTLLGIYRRLRSKTPPGLLIGLLLVWIFMARFGLEFLKARQAEYESQFTLSVGQLLSIPFILAGFVLLWCAGRKLRTTGITLASKTTDSSAETSRTSNLPERRS